MFSALDTLYIGFGLTVLGALSDDTFICSVATLFVAELIAGVQGLLIASLTILLSLAIPAASYAHTNIFAISTAYLVYICLFLTSCTF